MVHAQAGIGQGFSDSFAMVEVVVIVVFALALAFALVARSARIARRRRESIAAVVAANGLAYVEEDEALVSMFTGEPFGVASSRRARDVVSGAFSGVWFQTFAYSYETESRDSEGKTTTTTHRFQVTWVPLPASFPEIRIAPDSGLLRKLGALAGHDLDTESDAFNKQWRVRSGDERTAHAILTGPMIARLLEADVANRVVVFQGERLMSFVPGASSLTDLKDVVGLLQDIAALLPPFLIADHKGLPPA